VTLMKDIANSHMLGYALSVTAIVFTGWYLVSGDVKIEFSAIWWQLTQLNFWLWIVSHEWLETK
jgi:hypothetical protein